MSRIPIWHLIPEDPPQCDGTEIDIKLYNCGSILKGSILQSDGDYWWNGRFFEPELIGSWCNEFSEAAEQAGEPGEALTQMVDAITSSLIQCGLCASIDRGVVNATVAAEISSEMRPLLEKARARLIIENGTAEALIAELTRWGSR